MLAAVLLVVATRLALSRGLPLGAEDVASLLPATPRTDNETVAAIVQDDLVKHAVQSAVKNGSLAGLVVRKNVVIIPANAPDQVLSHKQQVLVAPVSHLEDIRKNVTGGRQPEVDGEYAHSSTDNGYNEQDNEHSITRTNSDAFESILVPSVKPEVDLPEGAVTQSLELPEEIERRLPVEVPVVAVLDPSKPTDDKVKGSILALLPNGNADSNTRRSVLENKREIREAVQNFLDRNSVTFDPENWTITRRSRIPESNSVNGGLFAASFVVEPSNDEDMDVAEDIVFRPLFQFRQEARERARYENRYRDSGYRRYNRYDTDRRPDYAYRWRNRYYNDY